MVRINGKKHAESLIIGYAISKAGDADAMVRAEIDGGLMVYQGPAQKVAQLVTGAGADAIKGRMLSLSLVE
jgi:hypothetical protein